MFQPIQQSISQLKHKRNFNKKVSYCKQIARQHSIRVTNILARAEGMVDCVKIFLTSLLVTMQNFGCYFSCCVRPCTRSQHFGDAVHDLASWYRAWLTPWKYALPTCVILPNVVVQGQTVQA